MQNIIRNREDCCFVDILESQDEHMSRSLFPKQNYDISHSMCMLFQYKLVPRNHTVFHYHLASYVIARVSNDD